MNLWSELYIQHQLLPLFYSQLLSPLLLIKINLGPEVEKQKLEAGSSCRESQRQNHSSEITFEVNCQSPDFCDITMGIVLFWNIYEYCSTISVLFFSLNKQKNMSKTLLQLCWYWWTAHWAFMLLTSYQVSLRHLRTKIQWSFIWLYQLAEMYCATKDSGRNFIRAFKLFMFRRIYRATCHTAPNLLVIRNEAFFTLK